MKKLVLLAVLAFAGFKLYQNGFSFLSSNGAFAEDGKPKVVLFVGPGCGRYCERVRSSLVARNLQFEEINIAGPDGAPIKNRYGVTKYPTTLIGDREVLGDDMAGLTAALAETLGRSALTRKEDRLMDNHFDAAGNAQVVMYATQWCPYCKKQRQYFAERGIRYKEIDVEASEANRSTYNAFEAGGYPLLYVGYRRFDGYTEGPIDAAIDELKRVGPRS